MSTPMPENFLIGSYRLYKADTAAVMLHLAKAAEKCNLEIPRRAVIASNTLTTSDGTAYLVAVNDIVPLARRVMNASQKPTPTVVLRTLGRAIVSRKRFTGWYKSKTINNPSLEARNASHEHFNSVLDELLEVLTLHSVEVSNEGTGDVKSTLESETAWQNRLGDLDLESLSQEASPELPNPDDRTSASENGATTESQSTEVPPPDVYEVEDPAEDVQFAIFNMTKDLHLLRQHIHGLLERYVGDNISLLSLSAIINTAIGTVRRTEKDLMESLPEFSSWEKVMETVVSPAQSKAVFAGLSDYVETSSQKDFLDSVYCLPFEELRQFRDSIVVNTTPRYLKGQVPISRLEASKIDQKDGWEPGKIIFNELFREVLSLQSTGKLPTEDELTRGIVDIFNKGPIHLWVVFGLQLFLDTQRILGEHVTRAFRELKATGSVFKNTVEGHIKLSQVIMKKTHTQEEQKIARQDLHLADKWISKDEFLELRQRQPLLGPGRPYFFLSHNPVVCGLFQFSLLLKLQRKGIFDLNGSGYGRSMAHLYNAAQTESHLTTNWPDMEKFLDFHGKEDLFTGGRPKTADQYLSQFLMINGVSVQHFAKDRRHKGIKFADDGPRRLKTSEIVENFEKLLCKTDRAQTDINVDLIETFLHRMAHTQSINTKKHDLIHARWEKSHMLTPIELLMLLEQCMVEEEPKLAFDYCAMHKQSWQLLASIAVELGTGFTDWLNRRFPKHDGNINFCLQYLPHYVFEKLADAQKSSKAAATKEDILARVGRMIDGFVSRKGKDPSPTVIGVVDDQELTTEFEHGTQNEVCIHWGRCEKTGTFGG